jgi:hypothetical protein
MYEASSTSHLARFLVSFSVLSGIPCAAASVANAVEEKSNPISGYQLVLMPATKHTAFFGWIRLLNGDQDAGYIYLEDGPSSDPALSSDKSYIITAMPTASLSMLLEVLRHEKNLQIRYYNPQSEGISPFVFLEPTAASSKNASSVFRLDDEQTKHVNEMLRSK